MALKSVILIILAVSFLVVPGMLYNNLNNNGLVVDQTQGLNCSSDPQTPTCQISGTVGCQASSAYCSLNGASISFLSISSPFTQLIQGNIFALFGNLNGAGDQGAGAQNTVFSSHGPFDVTANPHFYYANCDGRNNTNSLRQKDWSPGVCNQTFTDNKNMTSQQASNWTDWNTQQSGVTQQMSLISANIINGTFAHSCTWIGQINYTAVANGPGYTYFGCSISKPNHAVVISDPQWSYIIAMPVTLGTMPKGYSHQYLYVQPQNWAANFCPNTQGSVYASEGCQNFHNNFVGINIPGTAITYVPSGFSPLLGIFAGIALFILGTGLQFGFGGGFSAGSNEQGSKLAQVLGIGLLVWVPLYSEFGTWFTSGILPYGLDGSTGIMSLLLTGMMFFGLSWRAWSRD